MNSRIWILAICLSACAPQKDAPQVIAPSCQSAVVAYSSLKETLMAEAIGKPVMEIDPQTYEDVPQYISHCFYYPGLIYHYIEQEFGKPCGAVVIQGSNRYAGSFDAASEGVVTDIKIVDIYTLELIKKDYFSPLL